MAGRPPRFTEAQLREAIAESLSWADTLRALKYQSAGGNWRTLKKYAAKWRISTSHFDSNRASLVGLARMWEGKAPLEQILVEESTYSRAHLKERLFDEGVKHRRCELCGQDEHWRGERMALILDHINGIPNDNRLENLRIVCPNCAATFATHCGRKQKQPPAYRNCLRCGNRFLVKRPTHQYCSKACGIRWDRTGRAPPATRVFKRPPYAELKAEIAATSYCAVGRRYGVSDNAIRKWVKAYERELGTADSAEPPRDPSRPTIPGWPADSPS